VLPFLWGKGRIHTPYLQIHFSYFPCNLRSLLLLCIYGVMLCDGPWNLKGFKALFFFFFGSEASTF
jgi:hypothetical protein